MIQLFTRRARKILHACQLKQIVGEYQCGMITTTSIHHNLHCTCSDNRFLNIKKTYFHGTSKYG